VVDDLVAAGHVRRVAMDISTNNNMTSGSAGVVQHVVLFDPGFPEPTEDILAAIRAEIKQTDYAFKQPYWQVDKDVYNIWPPVNHDDRAATTGRKEGGAHKAVAGAEAGAVADARLLERAADGAGGGEGGRGGGEEGGGSAVVAVAADLDTAAAANDTNDAGRHMVNVKIQPTARYSRRGSRGKLRAHSQNLRDYEKAAQSGASGHHRGGGGTPSTLYTH